MQIGRVLEEAKPVAVEAALAAGRLAKARFAEEFVIEEKDEHGDLVTEVDHLAEQEILHRLREHFPDHQIRSEETGWRGAEGDWLWLVDPLDGTNNYAVGLPVYGVAITLLFQKKPMLGVIYDSHLEKLYVAERGRGATVNGQPLRLPERKPAKKRLTVGWIQGHHVQQRPEAMRLKHHLDLTCKRVLRLWAPTLAWAMVARGDLDGIVLYDSEGDDLYAGVLLAQEAGARVVDFKGNEFVTMNPEPYLVACHPDDEERFLQLAREGTHA